MKEVGGYILSEHLGSGNYGDVFKARLKKQPNKIFAIKQINK